MKKFLVLILLIVLSGCAYQGTGTSVYTPGIQTVIKNELVVEKPHTEVWIALLGELAKDVYVIKDIDTENRIITLSYSMSDPGDYVDCGRVQRTYEAGELVDNYEYDVAHGRSKYKVPMSDPESDNKHREYGILKNNSTLKGLIHIHVEPSYVDQNKTTVVVVVDYVMTTTTTGIMYSENIWGHTVSSKEIPEKTSLVAEFDTKSIFDSGSIKCCPTGTLESEILDVIKGVFK